MTQENPTPLPHGDAPQSFATTGPGRVWLALRHPAVLIGLGAIAGIIAGLILGDGAANLQFIGDMFIRLIQMSIVPLVMASVIVATGSMTGAGTGRLAARTFGWMLGFSALAAVVAWGLGGLFRPGDGMVFDGELDPTLQEEADKTEGWQDTLLNFVSTNVVEAMANADMLPIIVFSLIFGVALNSWMAKTGNRALLGLFEGIQNVVLLMIQYVMYVAPIGVFCLLASLTGEQGLSVVTSALSYLGVTALGVLILMVAFLVVIWLKTRLNVVKLGAKLAEQTVIAVTTTSSAVTFPTVLRNTVEKVGVSQRVANFTLSIGLTMGSYGAVLNYMIVIMFLAQAGGVDLSAGDIVLGVFLSIMLNMGTITVPGGFPVVAMFLASSLDLPVEAVGLLIAVDWFTGILRTFLNVNGDTFVAMLVAHDEKEIDHDVYHGRSTVTAEMDEDLLEDAARSDD
ncbi:dicarboxylate/amino acid:cation symporter [Corynebacterium variabile]|uniref:dicarboxylate/amino acid:cation symporter n=1 Tax=Corynebacterium variabile TaxID=1727 RepID=UPI003BAF1B5F